MQESEVPEPVRPTATRERVATLDVLRGVAILGILIVNIELFRGSDFYQVVMGEIPDYDGVDGAVQFGVGWLAYGKFLSSFALLFGLGAAMMSERAGVAGRPARGLLARRYVVLAVLGILHMTLLFAGDILFQYALAGFVLLLFLGVRARTARWWAVGIGVAYLVLAVGFTTLAATAPEPAADDPVMQEMEAFFADRAAFAEQAFTTGGLGEQVAARSIEALFLQSGQLFLLPWVLTLFLLGLAAGRAGLHRRLHEPWLRRTAMVALPVGLVLNLPSGFAGSLGAAAIGTGGEVDAAQTAGTMAAYLVGSPLLAVGYLSVIALLCQRPEVLARLDPLRRTGRMALTAYLSQSLLCTAFFVWLGFYDRLSPAAALLVVVAVWVIVVAGCTLWMSRFDMGPVERLWRRLTYGRARAGA
ncbi:DUF418 domain-containing protein [Egibacter rhizosphaerae]|uniref:DUF418 domain-containing protein n=1 Tax=Egibacter rhizosphaerae TaxID=1670831 RepID=A0A411YII7_9ACTN|nr:DUF418 domain-containing protein [Egibacter rhizosphaerae]QBI20961.1 DUF418 domain-containing protein [Egibacter rhizosphaerae]